MLYQDVIIAGFGGQGVMLIGNLLAFAGMNSGLNVTYIPVYGPEMRGGTANCTVVLSEEDIGSPIIRTPMSLIIMNRPSLEKFEPRLKDGGLQVINSSLVDPELADQGRVKNFFVPANDIADKLGNIRMANMVALGAYVSVTEVMPVKALQDALPDVISKRYEKMIPKNAEALAAGADAVKATA
jgi:2-oxoglutarate ferredoxin oxidoreductase subunit gamma